MLTPCGHHQLTDGEPHGTNGSNNQRACNADECISTAARREHDTTTSTATSHDESNGTVDHEQRYAGRSSATNSSSRGVERQRRHTDVHARSTTPISTRVQQHPTSVWRTWRNSTRKRRRKPRWKRATRTRSGHTPRYHTTHAIRGWYPTCPVRPRRTTAASYDVLQQNEVLLQPKCLLLVWIRRRGLAHERNLPPQKTGSPRRIHACKLHAVRASGISFLQEGNTQERVPVGLTVWGSEDRY